MRAGGLLLLSYYSPDILIPLKFTIEIICIKMCKTKFILVKNSLFVRKTFMLVYKLQDKLSPQTNEKYFFQ